jgi:hypothetical protein
MKANPPLIVSIALDEATHDHFTAQRNHYYPKHCNYLQAHCTLFHRLPSSLPLIDTVLAAAIHQSILSLQITGVKNTGNGVAYTISCAALQSLHQSLQRSLKPYLISKDRYKLRPHITIQNKVTAFKAAQTFELLAKDFKPFTAQGIGLKSWLYCKGFWQLQNVYPFIAAETI